MRTQFFHIFPIHTTLFYPQKLFQEAHRNREYIEDVPGTFLLSNSGRGFSDWRLTKRGEFEKTFQKCRNFFSELRLLWWFQKYETWLSAEKKSLSGIAWEAKMGLGYPPKMFAKKKSRTWWQGVSQRSQWRDYLGSNNLGRNEKLQVNHCCPTIQTNKHSPTVTRLDDFPIFQV